MMLLMCFDRTGAAEIDVWVFLRIHMQDVSAFVWMGCEQIDKPSRRHKWRMLGLSICPLCWVAWVTRAEESPALRGSLADKSGKGAACQTFQQDFSWQIWRKAEYLDQKCAKSAAATRML